MKIVDMSFVFTKDRHVIAEFDKEKNMFYFPHGKAWGKFDNDGNRIYCKDSDGNEFYGKPSSIEELLIGVPCKIRYINFVFTLDSGEKRFAEFDNEKNMFYFPADKVWRKFDRNGNTTIYFRNSARFNELRKYDQNDNCIYSKIFTNEFTDCSPVEYWYEYDELGNRISTKCKIGEEEIQCL